MNVNNIIEKLKSLLVTEKNDFGVIMNYFLTHIAENSVALEMSKPVTKDFDYFISLLTPVTVFYGKDISIKSVLFLSIPNTSFVHGALTLSNTRIVTLFYFKDIGMGLGACVSPLKERTDLFRISAIPITKH